MIDRFKPVHTQNLYKKVNSFQICQLIIIGVHTKTEEESSITPVNNLVIAELLTNRITDGQEVLRFKLLLRNCSGTLCLLAQLSDVLRP